MKKKIVRRIILLAGSFIFAWRVALDANVVVAAGFLPLAILIFSGLLKNVVCVRDLLTKIAAVTFSYYLIYVIFRRAFDISGIAAEITPEPAVILIFGILITFTLYLFVPQKKGDKYYFKINSLIKTRNVWEYKKSLKEITDGGDFSSAARSKLEDIIRSYGLENVDLSPINRKVFKKLVEDKFGKKSLSPADAASIQRILEFANLKLSDFGKTADEYENIQTLLKIENGALPSLDKESLNFAFEPGETLHFCADALGFPETYHINEISAVDVKNKGLIKRMMGAKPEIDVRQSTREETEYTDSGIFWITNLRVGYTGGKKGFVIPFRDLFSFTLHYNGLTLHKKYVDYPYVVILEDYDIPLALLQHYFTERRMK